jgi:hypothetical protein
LTFAIDLAIRNGLLITVPEGVPEIPAKATQIYPGILTQIGQNGYSDALSPSSPLIRNEQVSGSNPLIGSTSKRLIPDWMRRFCVWEGLRLATIEVEVPERVPEIMAKATLIYPGIHTPIGQYGYSDPLLPPSPLIPDDPKQNRVSGDAPVLQLDVLEDEVAPLTAKGSVCSPTTD